MTYIHTDSSYGVFDELEGLIMVFKSVPVGPISARLETGLTQLVRLHLLAQLSLDFQEGFHQIEVVSAFLGWQGASEVEDKVKSAELHFRSKGLASVENVEEKFWHCVTSHDISISEVAMKTLERR